MKLTKAWPVTRTNTLTVLQGWGGWWWVCPIRMNAGVEREGVARLEELSFLPDWEDVPMELLRTILPPHIG